MNKQLYWGMMINLGTNMWEDVSDTMRLDKPMWDEYMLYLQSKGVNMLLVDIGEALKFRCCPELPAKDAWSHEKFLAEMEAIRSLGMEVVPKLNFSTTHDQWLKEYGRMVSSPKYYEVCKNLIDEVCQILKPQYFHLGMDEESYHFQKGDDYAVVRQNDLWWHDLYYLQNCVEKNNTRAWIWSDYLCDHKEEFLKKMPKEIVQSNWYYMPFFSVEGIDYTDAEKNWFKRRIDAFQWLDEAGYDQIPTGSNWGCPENMENLVKFCAEKLDQSRMLGYLQTPWQKCMEAFRKQHWDAADLLANAKQWYEQR